MQALLETSPSLRRRLVWVTLSLCLTLGLFPIISEASRAQLTILHHMSGQIATDFQALATELGEGLDVEITTISAPGDLAMLERAMVMAAGGVLPDVIRVDQQQVRPLVRGGLLHGLTEYIRRDSVQLQNFIPLSVETFTYRGEQYAIPAEASTNILFFNRTMFQNAGVQAPTANWSSSTWTWDDFVNAAKRLTLDTAGTGKPEQYGLNTIGNFYFFPWLWGADWVTDDLKSFLGDSPEVVAALQRVVDLKHQYNVVDDGWGLFRRGKTAMDFAGNWTVSNLRESFFDWDLAASPKGTERNTVFFPNGFAISRDSEHKDVAWEIVKCLTLKKEGVQKYTDVVNRIPTHRAYWNYYLSSQERLTPGKTNRVSVDALVNGRNWTLRYATKWTDINTVVKRAWEQAWAGRTTVTSSMSQIAPQVNTLLAVTD